MRRATIGRKACGCRAGVTVSSRRRGQSKTGTTRTLAGTPFRTLVLAKPIPSGHGKQLPNCDRAWRTWPARFMPCYEGVLLVFEFSLCVYGSVTFNCTVLNAGRFTTVESRDVVPTVTRMHAEKPVDGLKSSRR